MTRPSSANQTAPRASPRVLASLVLCCLAPRALTALRLDAICNDAIFYIDLARHYEAGDIASGLGRLGLNVYPPILAALHHFGLTWENAGKLWGVSVASLAVLPVYGWIRRQFDERTALVAAVLYAFHPKLIEWSPEILRDPTFWLCWAAGLYTTWRAAEESSLRWYLVAGLTIALAAHTRFEGWFLFLPLVGWTTIKAIRGHLIEQSRATASNTNPKRQRGSASLFPRWRFGLVSAPEAPWAKPLSGVLLSIVVAPLLVLFVNVTLLRDLPKWELGNFERVGYVAQWWRATWHAGRASGHSGDEQDALVQTYGDSGAKLSQPPAAAASAIPASDARMAVSKMFQLYGNALRRGFGALFGLSWIVGILVGCRRLFRADHAILYLLAAAIAAAAWVHLWFGQATSSRYFLAIVIIACPCSAIGARYIYERLLGVVDVRLNTGWCRAALNMAFVLTVFAGGVAESVADRHDGRTRDAALGRWLLAELGPQSAIATMGSMPVVGFYAQTTPQVLLLGDIEALTDPVATVIAIQRKEESRSALAMINRLHDRGYQEVDRGRLPAGYGWNDLVVLKYGRSPRADGQLGDGERRPLE